MMLNPCYPQEAVRETTKAGRPMWIIFRDPSKYFWGNQHWNDDRGLPITLIACPQSERCSNRKDIFTMNCLIIHGHEGWRQIRWNFVQIVIPVNFQSRPNQRCRTKWWLDLFGGFSRSLKWPTSTLSCSAVHLNRNITTGLDRLNASLKIALNGTISP